MTKGRIELRQINQLGRGSDAETARKFSKSKVSPTERPTDRLTDLQKNHIDKNRYIEENELKNPQ